MGLNATGILDAIQSHALASGYFDRVNLHEPKNAPGNGLSAAIWVDEIRPVASGLAVTGALVTVNLRIFLNMLQEPQDAIDPNIVKAVDALMTAYSGDFTLGDLIRDVDLLGEHGDGLSAQAGYIEQDHKMFRVMTLKIPMVVNDVWAQVA
jgi:hypothetical protein